MNPEVFPVVSAGDSSFIERDSNGSILEETIEKKTVPTRQNIMNPDVYRAASTGDSSFFKSMKDPNSSTLLQVTIEKNTVLHLALQFKKFEAAENIVNLRPSLVYEKNSKGNTLLHVAAMVGNFKMVKLLIDQAKELDVETGGRQQLLSMVNQGGDTALHVAVQYGNFEVVKELIDENDPAKLAMQENNAGESALFLAVDRQHYDMASYILSAAPDCSYAGRHGMNVLHALVIHASSCKFCSIMLLKYLHFSFRMWSFRGVNVMAISHA